MAKLFYIHNKQTTLIRKVTHGKLRMCEGCYLKSSNFLKEYPDKAYNPCIAKYENHKYVYPCIGKLFGKDVNYIYIEKPFKSKQNERKEN